jgi:hypothetical protein
MSVAFRRLLTGLVGASLVIGLTAMPLSAAKPDKKLYKVDVQPWTAVNGETVDIAVTFTNTTPAGIASFTSVTLTVPVGFGFAPANVDVVETTVTGSAYGISVSQTAPYKITVTNLYPVGPGQSMTVQISDVLIEVEPTIDCSVQTFSWGSEAWTGSNTSGDKFLLSQLASVHNYTEVSQNGVPAGESATTGDGSVTATNVGATCARDVELTRTGDEVTLLKPDDVNAQFVIEVDAWDPEPAVLPLPVTQVDTPAPDHDIQWCVGSWDPADPTDTAGVSLPDGEVSCLLQQETHIVGGGNMQVTEVIYLDGDWSAKR